MFACGNVKQGKSDGFHHESRMRWKMDQFEHLPTDHYTFERPNNEEKGNIYRVTFLSQARGVEKSPEK